MLSRLVSRIPFQDIAQRMFIEEYDELSKDDGKQGNLRYDIGYTSMNQRDDSVVRGMNFPLCLRSKAKRVGNDETLEHTLFKAGCIVMRVSDEIQKLKRAQGHYQCDELFRNKE